MTLTLVPVDLNTDLALVVGGNLGVVAALDVGAQRRQVRERVSAVFAHVRALPCKRTQNVM